ncbi:MAG TPA: hypothetical protein VD927_08900 [Chryseosolibacter sp.]|nr:hypothetical protein [Chryseosolibacter sp.]
MRFFLFSVSVYLFFGCSSYYKNLSRTEVDHECLERIKPRPVSKSWYHASVDVFGKHLSGLLLIKPMADHSHRVVFSNESGITFFDFEFGSDGSFSVKRIIEQLDRRPVITTLKEDFELILGKPFLQPLTSWKHDNETYFGIENGRERIYFTTTDCKSLGRIEIGSRKKRKVSVSLVGDISSAPEGIIITHFTFPMTINLNKFENHVEE